MPSWCGVSLGHGAKLTNNQHLFAPPHKSRRVWRSAALAKAGSDVKAVVFELDQLLCNTGDLNARAGIVCFKEVYDVEVTEDDFGPLVGKGEEQYLKIVADKYEVDIMDMEEFKNAYHEALEVLSAESRATADVQGGLDLIWSCRKAGLKTALTSSMDRANMEARLIAAHIPIDIFDVTISSNDGIEDVIPSPQVFLEAARRLDVEPRDCIVIEDSDGGVQAAKTAGMVCLAVATTVSAEILANMSEDTVFTNISSISLPNLSEAHQKSLQDDSASVGWLDKFIDLPGGYKTSRRDALKIASAAWVLFGGYAMISRGKAMSFASPKAVLNLFNPRAMNVDVGDEDRVDAFEQYFANLEKRGGGQKVPAFPMGADWLNSAPLKWNRELKGKIVVLDFWTYCCINCMHILPDLATIERNFSGQPVEVVGVHSAKFDNEKDSDAIRNAVVRYDVTHPVVNDRFMTMWKGLGVNSWPTLAVISPRGNLLFMLTGERHLEDLNTLITAALNFYGKRQELDNTPIAQELERDKDAKLLKSPLRFPGKIETDLDGGRIFISDSGNHRILITTLNGEFVSHVGGNGSGLIDGSFEECAFNRPQGVAYDAQREVLYVADTENHALREVNLKSGKVSTLAGNGYQGQDYKGGNKGANQQLSSPWDVELDAQGKNVYIAIAGQHQIWRYNMDSGITNVFSGNGAEKNKNGGSGNDTSWAQPSGLSLSEDGSYMYVADSESSSIRRLDLTSGGSKPCVGGDNLFAENLFDFGDQDGIGATANLQHPLGVCQADDGQVYVADSYNHRIKVLDPVLNSITALAGSGQAGFGDGVGLNARLSEPGGLAKGPDGSILVADTNNGLIRVIKNGRVTTKQLTGVPPPRSSPLEPAGGEEPASAPGKIIVADVLSSSSGDLDVLVNFPPGFNYTKGANSTFKARAVGPSSSDIQLTPSSGSLSQSGSGATKIGFVAPETMTGVNKLQIDAKLYFCEEGEACLFEELRIESQFASNLTSGNSVTKVEIKPSRTAPLLE